MPAAFAAGILPLELALHGWDIAQAAASAMQISDELVDYLRGLAEGLVPGGRGRLVRATRSSRPKAPVRSTGSRRTQDGTALV